MHRRNLILTVILSTIFLATSPAWAITYYIDDTGGNNSNNGTSEGTAWADYTKVESQACSAGDKFLFKRGGVWLTTTFGDFDFVTCSGNSSNSVVIDAYGTGTLPKISSMRILANSGTAENWTDNGGNVWYITSTLTSIGTILLDDVRYTQATSAATVDSSKRWFLSDAQDRVYVYATENPATFYTTIKDNNNAITTAQVTSRNYITIRNMDFEGGNIALAISRASNALVEYNTIGKYAGDGFFVTGGTSSPFTHSDYGVFRYNTVESGFNDPTHTVSGGSDGIDFRDGANHWEIYGNTISNWRHDGFSMQCTEDPDDYGDCVNYNQFYENYITGENSNYMRPFSTGGPANGCMYNVITRNYFYKMKVSAHVNGEYNRISYNVWDTVTNSPADTASGSAIDIEAFSPYISKYNIIENNTMVNLDEAGIYVHDNGSKLEKRGNIIRNNLILNPGLNSELSGGTNVGIFVEDAGHVFDFEYKNNLVYTAATTSTVRYKGTTMTVGTFNSADSGGDVISGNISSDPLLANATDFHLTASSPAKDAGLQNESTQDYPGNPTCVGAGCDIGAYEYTGGIRSAGVLLTGVKTQ